MLTIELRMVSTFWARTPISFKHKSFWCPFVDPLLTPYHQNIGVQIIAKLELGTSTLHCLHGQTVFNIVKCIVFGLASNMSALPLVWACVGLLSLIGMFAAILAHTQLFFVRSMILLVICGRAVIRCFLISKPFTRVSWEDFGHNRPTS